MQITLSKIREVFFSRKPSYLRYSILADFLNWVYPKTIHTEFGKTFLHDPSFNEIFKRFEGRNLKSMDRKYMVIQLLKLTKKLQGDTVECGVFQGATSYLILKNISPQKTHHIFDSFEGLSEPDDMDGSYWDKNVLRCPEDTVRLNLQEFSNVQYHKGWIPDKFNEAADRAFSFVHIDVDLYQPTKDSIEFFYPRMEDGGIILCDDYGFSTCPGAKKAIDEFAIGKGLEILDLPTGQGLIIKS